ncbi:uncharacterized protein LOC129728192 [Wyeomyia smithii]|uniref:uncharacterized protein LOC129728192 n=1 Tax=Wyeomyia smithii TaxID=174621 RepID=UPI002467F339|nr:uncharacterized protein LOC129728192 [Wyeomyia smithii]
MPAELRRLQKREHQLLKSLEGARLFIQRFDAEKDEGKISLRLQGLEDIFKEFFTVRGQIELLLEDAEVQKHSNSELEVKQEALTHLDDENDRAMQDFEDKYYDIKAELLTLLPNRLPTLLRTSSHSSIAPSDGTEPQFSKVKLPEIRLPLFNGKIFEWVPFRDSFQSLIHINPQLSDMDRFTYLRSALVGDVLQEISSIGLSAANYSIAWTALQNRFENKKLIVKAHLDALFSVEGLKKESYEQLNHLLTDFEKNLQMLEKIGQDTSMGDSPQFEGCSKLFSNNGVSSVPLRCTSVSGTSSILKQIRAAIVKINSLSRYHDIDEQMCIL